MRGLKAPAWTAVLAVVLTLAAVTAAGCGKPASPARSEEERVAEEALRAAMRGDGEAFLRLVAPSFLEVARAEMPEADDETLGAVLLAGFTEDVPYGGVEEPVFQVDVEGDRAVVHVWGVFLDREGNRMDLGEGEALRVPLRREEGSWYVDLLDL